MNQKNKLKNNIIVAKFGSVHGVKGWLKVVSFTHPQENILSYKPWFIGCGEDWQELVVVDEVVQNQQILVKLLDLDDRERAKRFTNSLIAVNREQLPKLPKGEYYWFDLEGLEVINKNGETLGSVAKIIATSANDVLVVTKENAKTLIPYLSKTVLDVNLEAKVMQVDWDLSW